MGWEFDTVEVVFFNTVSIMPRVVHFEIHASDPQRAVKFYSDVFGWDIKKWGAPEGAYDGDMQYWLVMTGSSGSETKGKEGQGIDGGLLVRRGPAPAEGQPVNAFVCTIEVENVDAFVAKVTGAGGTVAAPKMPVPSVGWLAYCKDTEGNIFGMMQNDPTVTAEMAAQAQKEMEAEQAAVV